MPENNRIQFRISKKALVPTQDETQCQAVLSIDEGDMEKDLWIKGRIITMPGYTFVAKVYDAPSEHGIEEGNISKLQVKKDGKQVINYDRGWDDKPKTAEHREALQRIRNGLDNGQSKGIKHPDHGQDKSTEIDR